MSYQANLDIVIAMETLRISSFKKQGTIRFKVSLYTRNQKEQPEKNSKVTVWIYSNIRTSPSATLITSTNSKKNNLSCTFLPTQTSIGNSTSKYGT